MNDKPKCVICKQDLIEGTYLKYIDKFYHVKCWNDIAKGINTYKKMNEDIEERSK